MSIKSTAAMIELRALITAGQYTGTRIKRLVIKASSSHENTDRLHCLVDELHIYLEQAEVEEREGVGPFSLPLVFEILDDLEYGTDRAKSSKP